MAARASGALQERLRENAETLNRQAEVIRAILTGANGAPPAIGGQHASSQASKLGQES